MALEILSPYLSKHILNVSIGLRMRPRRHFSCALLLDSEMDSNLTWIGPPTWIGLCACLVLTLATRQKPHGDVLIILPFLKQSHPRRQVSVLQKVSDRRRRHSASNRVICKANILKKQSIGIIRICCSRSGTKRNTTF